MKNNVYRRSNLYEMHECRQEKCKAIMKGTYRSSMLPLGTRGSFEKREKQESSSLIDIIKLKFILVSKIEKNKLHALSSTQILLFLQTGANAI